MSARFNLASSINSLKFVNYVYACELVCFCIMLRRVAHPLIYCYLWWKHLKKTFFVVLSCEDTCTVNICLLCSYKNEINVEKREKFVISQIILMWVFFRQWATKGDEKYGLKFPHQKKLICLLIAQLKHCPKSINLWYNVMKLKILRFSLENLLNGSPANVIRCDDTLNCFVKYKQTSKKNIERIIGSSAHRISHVG